MLELPVPAAFLDLAITTGPAHFRPLLRVLRDKGCALAIVPQGRRPFALPRDRQRPDRQRAATRRPVPDRVRVRGPVICIVGDDLHQALGPTGFHRPSLRRVLAGSVALIIVSGEPDPTAYALAATSAAGLCPLGLGWNAVLVETRPERESEWLAFATKHRPDLLVTLYRSHPEGAQ